MSLFQDIRYGARLLVKDRWFTLAAALALALGIGVNATVFTLVNAVLIRGLPFYEPDRIMAVSTQDGRGNRNGVSNEDFEDWRDQVHSFSHLVLTLGTSVNVSDNGQPPERAQGVGGCWALRFISICPRRIEHQSLWSAIGMPHSTQTPLANSRVGWFLT